MNTRISLLLFLAFVFSSAALAAPEMSAQTRACLGCHEKYTPGIVADWRGSAHAGTTPAAAMAKPEIERTVSAAGVPDGLRDTPVGCFECHSLNAEAHKDNFSHFGRKINVVVSPDDCAVCHPVERDEYAKSKKGMALNNLRDNPVYSLLVDSITGVSAVENGRLAAKGSAYSTKAASCYACHGTEVGVDGMKDVETEMGTVSVPNLTNWPNHGVGRHNPDGSRGSCSVCHPRHGLSIEVARKPHTCAQCHLEPDTPAWNVYAESKHGNIYESKGEGWNWSAVPWRPGEDFTAPTCAACHVSLLAGPDGDVIARRSHDFGSRLWVRLFGLPFAAAQPKEGNTTALRNRDGLPLPTTLDGVPAAEGLIDEAEQVRRRDTMKAVCLSCHGATHTDGHFAAIDHAIDESNAMTLAASELLARAWESGKADKTNPFDEPIEKKWIRQWLFYANSVRYAAAMSGPDYAAFKNGWWNLTENLGEIERSSGAADQK